MDSNPSLDFLYDPELAFPTDALESPLAVNGSTTDSGAIDTSGGSDSPAGVFGSIGSAASSIGANPTARFLALLLPILLPLIGPISEGIDEAVHHGPIHFFKNIIKHIERSANIAAMADGRFWQWMSSITFDKVFHAYLEDGLGLDMDKLTADAGDAIHTVDTMLGFSLALQFGLTAVDAAGKALLGGRWPESIHEALGKIPEEMGMTWAMGMTIEESFKAAQGVILEEGINKQKRPNRLQWPQLRTMLKQHIITDEKVLNDLLAAQGFPDEQIEWLKKLKDVQVPVGDIAQLYFREIIDGDTAKRLIGELGFSDEQATYLYDLYVAKAENEASVTYRGVAGRLFLGHLITESQYRDILSSANFPSRLIDENVQAFKLEQDVGRVLHTVSALKSNFQHGIIKEQEAQQALRELNYAPGDVADIIESWKVKPLKKTHGLSEAKVLSYYVSKVINEDTARSMLGNLGIDAPSIDLLIAHPTVNSRAVQHKPSAGLITQAFIDGAIPMNALADAYSALGYDVNAVSYLVNAAIHRATNTRYSATADLPLTRGDMEAAFKNGLVDFPGLVSMLETLGYGPDNAMLIAEIANKGPYQPQRPTATMTLLEAIEYMTSHGFNVIPPPDPMLMEAEGVLASNGYTWQPITSLPPPHPPPPPPVPIPG